MRIPFERVSRELLSGLVAHGSAIVERSRESFLLRHQKNSRLPTPRLRREYDDHVKSHKGTALSPPDLFAHTAIPLLTRRLIVPR